MGFLSEGQKGESIYLEISEVQRKIRPLAVKPTSLWGHVIQEIAIQVPGGNPTVIRAYATHPCTSTGRGGVGCKLCSTPDPHWSKLAAKDQVNKKGQRVDFGKKPKHFMAVWDYMLSKVMIMKGGNQLFKGMDQYYDMQPEGMKDLRTCDWVVWKTGKKMFTQYQSQRFDATPFTITPEIQLAAENALKAAVLNEAPVSSEQLEAMITGQATQEAQAAAAAAMPPPDTSVPFVPTNVTPVQAVAVAIPVPAAPQHTPVAPVAVAVPATPQPVAMPTAPVAAPGAPAPKAEIEAFTAWINTQQEFTGTGVVTLLLPAMKEVLGHAEYHKSTSAQLTQLREVLTLKVAQARGGK